VLQAPPSVCLPLQTVDTGWSASYAEKDKAIGGVKNGQVHAAAHVGSSVALSGYLKPCEKWCTYTSASPCAWQLVDGRE
jgi:hypothetical protein